MGPLPPWVAAVVGAGAQQLTTTSIPLDKAYPLLVLLGLSVLPLLLSTANAVAKAVTGEALFIGRMDSPASLASSVLRQRI